MFLYLKYVRGVMIRTCLQKGLGSI